MLARPSARPPAILCEDILGGLSHLVDLLPQLGEVDTHVAQHERRHAARLPDDAEQEMLRRHLVVIEHLGLAARQREHLLGASCQRASGVGRSVGAAAGTGNLGPNLHRDDAVLAEQRGCDVVVAGEQPEQYVLGSRELVTEADGLLAGDRKNLLTLRTEGTHVL